MLDFSFLRDGVCMGFFSKVILVRYDSTKHEIYEPLMKIILEYLQKVKCKYSHTLKKLSLALTILCASSVPQLCPPLQTNRLRQARLPYPPLTPGARSNSCPSSRWCHPTSSSSDIPFSSCLQSFPASESYSHQVVKVLELQLQNQSYEYSALISCRIDWLDLLAAQGTLKSLLQHHTSKASILWCSAFSMVQLSHPSVITGKIVTLSRQTFVGKAVPLLLICCLGWS